MGSVVLAMFSFLVSDSGGVGFGRVGFGQNSGRLFQSQGVLGESIDQELSYSNSRSRLISRAGGEWVNSPMDIRCTPVLATSRTVLKLMPPEASTTA